MRVFDFIGIVASGWLSNCYNNRVLLFWYYDLRGLSLLYLPFSGFDAIPLAVFYGLDWIATVPPTVKLTAQAFGPALALDAYGKSFRCGKIALAERIVEKMETGVIFSCETCFQPLSLKSAQGGEAHL